MIRFLAALIFALMLSPAPRAAAMAPGSWKEMSHTFESFGRERKVLLNRGVFRITLLAYDAEKKAARAAERHPDGHVEQLAYTADNFVHPEEGAEYVRDCKKVHGGELVTWQGRKFRGKIQACRVDALANPEFDDTAVRISTYIGSVPFGLLEYSECRRDRCSIVELTGYGVK